MFFFSFSFYSGSLPKCSGFAGQGKVCARFAQDFDNSAKQLRDIGEQMILANQGQHRAQTSRKLTQTHCKLGLPKPPRAFAPPHVFFFGFGVVPHSEHSLS